MTQSSPSHRKQKYSSIRHNQGSRTTTPLPPFLAATKFKCFRALNILEILSHSTYGCNREIQIPFYTTLIRSILDTAKQVMASILSFNWTFSNYSKTPHCEQLRERFGPVDPPACAQTQASLRFITADSLSQLNSSPRSSSIQIYPPVNTSPTLLPPFSLITTSVPNSNVNFPETSDFTPSTQSSRQPHRGSSLHRQ